MTAPTLSKQSLWDVDMSSLDYERDSLFIIGKVFNFGSWDDVKAVIACYGRVRLKKEVVQLADLKKDTISFLCLLLNLDKANFKCYLRRQSQPTHWNY